MSNKDIYQAHQARKNELLELLQKSATALTKLGLVGRADSTRKLLDRVASDSFKILVIGEFKRGKSTFINALMGEEILPAFATPCTAVINEIKWGEEKKAKLHFKIPLPKSLPNGLPSKVTTHIQQHRTKAEIPPIEIDVKNLEEFVVISDPSMEQAESISETPYEKVEIFWPIDLCKNGVEIIDSPGLNEHGTRTKVTTNYVSKADAVIFVMSCQALASQSELNVVDNQIRKMGYEDIFFVANRFDEIRKRERDRLIAYGQKKLAPRTSRGAQWVFFLSALDALEGRLDEEPEMIERSGIHILENELAKFLTHDRGRIKLLQPTRSLLQGIRNARDKKIPSQRNMLNSSLHELEQKYEKNKPALEDAVHRQRQIEKRVLLHRQRLEGEVRDLAHSRLKEIAKMLPQWAEKFEPENSFKVLKISSSKAQIKALIKEIMEHLTQCIEEAQNEWLIEILQPVVASHLDDMTKDIESNIQDFFHHIDLINADITGIFNEEESDENDISALERVLAAAGGFFIGGVGSAIVGGSFGFKEMAKSILPQLALVFGLMIVQVTNPWIFIIALFGGGLAQSFLKASSITNQTKKNIAEKIAQELEENAYSSAKVIAQTVFEETHSIQTEIHKGLEVEIQSIRGQVESILKDKRAGETEVANKKLALKEVEKDIREIETSLTDLLFKLASH